MLRPTASHIERSETERKPDSQVADRGLKEVNRYLRTAGAVYYESSMDLLHVSGQERIC